MKILHTLIVTSAMLFASTKTLLASEISDSSYETGTVTNALNASAFKMFSTIETKNSEGNIIISPFSIFSGIAMAYTGAENKTKDQISKTFYINKNRKAFLDSLKSFIDTLVPNSRNTLKNSNSIWVQDNYKIKDSYSLSLNKYFTTEFHRMNILSVDSLEYSRKRINNWVEKETSGKIKDLLSPGILDTKTRILLINTIYFKDAWKNPFNGRTTSMENFSFL